MVNAFYHVEMIQHPYFTRKYGFSVISTGETPLKVYRRHGKPREVILIFQKIKYFEKILNFFFQIIDYHVFQHEIKFGSGKQASTGKALCNSFDLRWLIRF